MAKFNFLAHRTAPQKAAADLQRRFPKHSPNWIQTKARQAAGADDITTELRAPERVASFERGAK